MEIRDRLARQPSLAMAAGTTLSRATGLGRTLALASVLGLGALSDAYNLANTVPNMLFTLVVGGPIASALVPVLVAARKDGDDSATAVVFTALMVAGAAAGVALFVAAPAVIDALAPSGVGRTDPARGSELATYWLRLFAAQVPLYALGVFGVGVMTVHGRFALGSIAPVLTNVGVGTAALGFGVLASQRSTAVEGAAVLVLGLGTTSAVAATSLVQLWGARRVDPGVRFTRRGLWRHPALADVIRLGAWTLLYVGVNQVGLAVVTAMASEVEGGISAYQWAFMIMQLPYAVVAVSVISAAVPELAAADDGAVREILAKPIRTTATLIIPAAAGLALVAGPVAAVVLGGAGDPILANAIRGFAASLVPFCFFQLLCRASYARRDSRSPALVNIAVNVVNVVAAAAALSTTGSPGGRILALTLAHAASYVVGCVLIARALRRREGRGVAVRRRHVARPVAATAAMGTALVPLSATLNHHAVGRGSAVAVVAATCLLGAFVYAGVGRVIGLRLGPVTAVRLR